MNPEKSGLLVKTVGIDSISGISRFTFGSDLLYDGFTLIPALIGLFAVSVVFEKENSEEEMVMENVSLLETSDDGIQVSSLFDPPKKVDGVKVIKIDFMNGKVFLGAK